MIDHRPLYNLSSTYPFEMSIPQRPTQTPDGYVPIQMEDGERYLVPHFVVLATHQAFNAYHVKADTNNAKGEVSFFLFF